MLPRSRIIGLCYNNSDFMKLDEAVMKYSNFVAFIVWTVGR